jgi:hypothetical protein
MQSCVPMGQEVLHNSIIILHDSQIHKFGYWDIGILDQSDQLEIKNV